MRISKELNDKAVLEELGERLARARIQHDLTQAELAEKTGVSKRTVERLESGEVASQLSALLRVCRALDLIDRFDALLPEAALGPMAQLKTKGRERQRAKRKKAAAVSKKWTWSEQS
jgi:transcriptional regulator with XRE-family HTH domain